MVNFYSAHWLECIVDPYEGMTDILEELVSDLITVIPVSTFDTAWNVLGGTVDDGEYDNYLSAFLLTEVFIPDPPNPDIEGYEMNLFFWSDVVDSIENIPVEDRPCPFKDMGQYP